jgi:uncharacterized tellurite resistance protein B-like protein
MHDLQLDASDFAAMDDAQRLAVLEAMIVGLIADDQVNPRELQRFDQLVTTLPWGIDTDVLTAMIRGAKDRLLALSSREQIHDYVAGLAARLPSPRLREKVIYTMATLMVADDEVNQIEKNVLGLFIVAFNLTSDRVAAVKAALDGSDAPSRPRSTDN